MAATTWNAAELDEIATRDELHIAPRRADGTLAKPRIVWMVRIDDDMYIRSAYGADGAWYRTTRTSREGHVNVGAVDKDVTFADIPASDNIQERIDAAYHAKYDRYPGPVASITAEAARATTLRVLPIG